MIEKSCTGEHYSPHYDNAPGTDIHLHFVTFQIVLFTSDDFSGGDTLFPHSYNDNTDTYTMQRIKSDKYSAIFWYNLISDGNVDEASMYAHEMVNSGSQIFAHVSIWDPSLPEKGDPRMTHDRVYSIHDEL